MRRAAALVLSLFAGFVVVGSAATDAVAAPRAPRSLARFELHGSNGYRASVEASGPRLRLTLERFKPIVTMVRYSVRATTTPGGVRARLGDLGRISVRFKPTGTARRVWPPHECDGPAVPGRVGTFSGTIRFRGEDGYVELEARRAAGRTATSSRWSCGPGTGFLRRTASSSAEVPREEEAEPPIFAVLGAATRNSGRQFFALASHPDERELPFFSAGTIERRQGMRIRRVVAVGGPTRSFVFEDNLRNATVQPPPPFSGSASFERVAQGRKTWTGDLSVSFPGRSGVPLAGPKFESAISHEVPGD